MGQEEQGEERRGRGTSKGSGAGLSYPTQQVRQGQGLGGSGLHSGGPEDSLSSPVEAMQAILQSMGSSAHWPFLVPQHPAFAVLG